MIGTCHRLTLFRDRSPQTLTGTAAGKEQLRRLQADSVGGLDTRARLLLGCCLSSTGNLSTKQAVLADERQQPAGEESLLD